MRYNKAMKETITVAAAILYRRSDASFGNPSEIRVMTHWCDFELDVRLVSAENLPFLYSRMQATLVNQVAQLIEDQSPMYSWQIEGTYLFIKTQVGDYYIPVAIFGVPTFVHVEMLKQQLPASNQMWNRITADMKQNRAAGCMYVGNVSALFMEQSEFSIPAENWENTNAVYKVAVAKEW